ncbi:MAG: hypothetical protein A4S09_14310 [Proteobacteria bacterium SG_bin7]|nr:MAG: hypothetical protein A4S09_14310 [Proteobacteria bacterium SG_bin7]
MLPFELELKQSFLEEAGQLLSDVEQCFLQLENGDDNSETFNKIFRLAHNLKGSARAVGFDAVGIFAHEFESFLLKIKNGELKGGKATVDLLLRCNDHLIEIIESLKADIDSVVDSSELIAAIQSHSSEADDLEKKLTEKKKTEIFPLKNSPNSVKSPTPANSLSVEEAQKSTSEDSIRVSLARLEKLVNYVGELVILQTVLHEQTLNHNPILLRRTSHQIGKVIKEVQDISMSLRMVPLRQTFQKMQRIVRDTSSVLNKQVSLTLRGENTEVDKTILDQIGDPLVHLIRNACDHGIEAKDVRLSRGKSEIGSINLNAYHKSDRLVIEVSDDGGGLDPERLRKKGIEKGIVSADQQISDQDAINLIFHSGFSTKSQVSEVSGRGVGMDVVKTNIEALQGEVQVETSLGHGTTFKVILPLTLAIIDGMIVRTDDSRFVIPLAHVHETVRPKDNEVQYTTCAGEVLLLRGETLPVFRLSHLLGKRPKTKEEIALVFKSHLLTFAVLVHDIIGQHQVVIKKLGEEIKMLKGFSGSAILGDGRPALIIEITELIQNTKGHLRNQGNLAGRATA